MLTAEIEHFRSLGQKILSQARRRVIGGEKVPNDEKIFSIFEPHTELLKRGKASKPIEFGHMVLIQQVAGKFITDYRVFGLTMRWLTRRQRTTRRPSGHRRYVGIVSSVNGRAANTGDTAVMCKSES